MASREYYSYRTGKNTNRMRLELPALRSHLVEVYRIFNQKSYFDQAFGYYSDQTGPVAGDAVYDVGAYVELKLRKTNLWPIEDHASDYAEDDVFDLVEFLFDHVSKPPRGPQSTPDKTEGQAEYRTRVNEFLTFYQDGYDLSEEGEILSREPDGLSSIFEAEVRHPDNENVVARVQAAIRKFRLRGSTSDDRRDAVRDLADVLERLRPEIKELLTRKDESDLFELANRFGIRHHKEDQATDYDKDIWYSWAFYYYLATIHASLRLIERRQGKP